VCVCVQIKKRFKKSEGGIKKLRIFIKICGWVAGWLVWGGVGWCGAGGCERVRTLYIRG
jgi:hypothetical protein